MLTWLGNPDVRDLTQMNEKITFNKHKEETPTRETYTEEKEQTKTEGLNTQDEEYQVRS